MEDRLIELSGIPDDAIKSHQLEFLLEDEYIVPEGIFVLEDEVKEYQRAANEVYEIFEEELHKLVKARDFRLFDFPSQLEDLIVHSAEQKHAHLLGRFDFAGGIDGLPIKLLEFNADMPTMLPESTIIQAGFNDIMGGLPYDNLLEQLGVAYNWLGITAQREKLMLGTSLGHAEDIANMSVLLDCAAAEGFETMYADLPQVEFAKNEGVFVQLEDQSYLQFDFLLKLVPWEFICYEEPGLLDDLHNLQLQDLIYVLNPAYTLVFQSKVFMAQLYKRYSSNFLLKTSTRAEDFISRRHVKKPYLGRLGQRISILDRRGKLLDATEGDLEVDKWIYQEFAELYKDNCDEYYQPGIYTVRGKSAGLSFRRAERLIVDDDCQYIPHFIRS